MNMYIIFLVLLVVIIFIIAGFYIVNLNTYKQLNLFRKENELMRVKELGYIRDIAKLQSLVEAKDEILSSRNNEISQIRQEMNKDFQLMVNQIFEEKTSKFTDHNKMNMESILKPLQEKLADFKIKIEETYDKESKQRFSLEDRIKELIQLNNKISSEANNLTQALKGNNKIQGNWGEMILESILEKSGLKKGQEYYSQTFLKDELGYKLTNEESKGLQPDIIVNYPGGRKIIIDSKVSLTAYLKYLEAENEAEKLNAEKQHLLSIKKHIDELSQKSYQTFIDSLDFVMMFIPNESAYIAAMKSDNSLWDYAYNRNVLLINPTNLIASLKVVSDLWKREYQSQNAREIANRGRILYDKFVGFEKTLRDLGANIERTQKFYEKSMNQLREGNGNLIWQAETLKELGIKSQKELPTEKRVE